MTRQCLDRLLSGTESTAFDLTVVDDASTDDTQTVLAAYEPRVRVVRHARNEGFARSCNDGAAASAGEYVVFLNNDTIPQRGWLDALVAYADSTPAAAAVGSKLLFPNGLVQHAGLVIGRDRFPRHVYAGFPGDHPAVCRSRRFQAVTGACVLVRRTAFEDADGFDPTFLNGYEDVDLCLRLGERGLESHLCHESVLVHLESVSRTPERYEELNRLFLERWGGRVRPDDLDVYVDDGLLGIDGGDTYPLRLVLAPRLGVLTGPGEDPRDGLIGRRSNQAFALLKRTVASYVELLEQAGGAAPARRDSPFLAAPAAAGAAVAAPNRRSDGVWHELGAAGTLPDVSVLMPVKDAGAELRKLIPSVLSQAYDGRVEVVAVDSGSVDDTVDVLLEHRATVLEIEPAAFNHGRTRNLAAKHARGEVLVFLNKASLPADGEWLARLVAPLWDDARVAGVTSRVAPLPTADVLVQRDVLRSPSGSRERIVRDLESVDAFRRLPEPERRLLVNFHTVGCAIRPSALRAHPFREAVTIGEDMAWAQDVLEAGWRIVHEPTSVVLHSHAYGPLEILRLNVDDGIANRAIVGRTMDEGEVAPLIQALVRDDWRYLAEECRLSEAELERWRLTAAVRRTAQVVGHWIGVNHDGRGRDLAWRLSRIEATRAGAVRA